MARTKHALALAAAAAAVVAKRRTAKPYDDDASLTLPGRVRQVEALDGVPLHVEVHGAEDATATVVLAHGYIQSNRTWDRQIPGLLAARPDLRVVTYDHRGHGSSGRSGADGCTFEQLGQDLLTVIEATAPTGPVVVAGHSMGGMAVMAFAELFPTLVGPRLAAVALVATSAGPLGDITYGLPKPLGRVALMLLPRAHELARRRELAGKKALPNGWMSRVIFGKGARPADVRRTMEMMHRCSAGTVADFHPSFVTHDRITALAALSEIPVLVLAGSKDVVCPLAHSEAMARALPHAQLVVYPGAGHMLGLERDVEVTTALVGLCDALPRPSTKTAARAS